jgi:LacI family transcriptional regulator/LacI family repressor for deo operon, udp, cdd, tsx, nupC, and nupG
MTIKTIAKIAGVSIATVSRVINGSSKVRPNTSKRIMKIVEEMNYQRDNVARRMKVKTSEAFIFGLVITDISNPFFANIARGVEEFAYANKHVMFMCNTNESPEKEKYFLNAMVSEKVSGVIIVPTAGDNLLFSMLISRGLPMVMIDRIKKNLNIDSVSINNELGSFIGVERLLKNGHKRIGIINGIKGLSNSEERFLGYKKAMEKANVPFAADLITYGNFNEVDGRKAMKTFLGLKNPPTAVFSTNNLMTLGAIKEIHQQKLLIPDDIALIGFDDSVWSEALTPPLTTIQQPGYELGLRAAELLYNRLKNRDAKKVNIILNPELIIRESCGSSQTTGNRSMG